MILAIDFDDTIHDPRNRKAGYKLGKPMPGAAAALTELARNGHTIVVHSVWADTPAGQEQIRKWMQFFHLPCHNVTAKKPAAEVYIDDRGYRFTSWDVTMADLERILG